METKDYWIKNIFYHYGVGYVVMPNLQTSMYRPELEKKEGIPVDNPVDSVV